MARAVKACRIPTCPNIRPCPEPGHEPKAWEKRNPRSERRLSGSRQQKRSRYILEKYELICHICGGFGADEVDHVVPLAEGGADDESNLRPIHLQPCHREKTRAEAQRAWKAARNEAITLPASSRVPSHVLVLVGAPAVGKTWVAERLASETGWSYRSIDDCGPRGHHSERWTNMLRWLSSLDRDRAIVECNRPAPELMQCLTIRGDWYRIVELTAPDQLRERRLAKRGGSWSSLSYAASPLVTERLEAAVALAPLTGLLTGAEADITV